jgi:pimeloyl-ACP methyl ester carboxylesterase
MATGTSWAMAEDGTRLACETSGEGDPLVLVHSASSDARQWARVEPLLAPRFRLVAMNRRGRRGSGPIRAGHSLEVEYGDVAAVVGSIPGPVHLLGHSSGARFALHAAGRTSNVASLILYEPPAPESLSDEVLASLSRLEAAGDQEGILRVFLLDVLENTDEDLEALRQRPIWPLLLDNALTLPAELLAARRYRLDPSELADLPVPTAVLVGQLSGPEVRAPAREVAASLPDATVVPLPGAGHGAMFSDPELFAAEVARFIAGVAARGR